MATSTSALPIHVAVGVITNAAGEVLIAKRPAHVHQGGFWEFPGGKVEPGESIQMALGRELTEELAIAVQRARPLIRIPFDYTDKKVLLDVWQVTAFAGQPVGCEGQPIQWVRREALRDYQFPAANYPIVTAVCLPDSYLVTPEPGGVGGEQAFVCGFQRVLESKRFPLIQLRAKTLSASAYRDLAAVCVPLARSAGIAVLLNGDMALALELGAAGVHFTSAQLAELAPVVKPHGFWVGASCHSALDLALADKVGADFAVLGPVMPTSSHPDASGLGWGTFERLTESALLPVYAIGGLGPGDASAAWQAGGQGVAGISAFWPA